MLAITKRLFRTSPPRVLVDSGEGNTPPVEYRLIVSLFLRCLALIYLTAFASIGVQIVGLVGVDGILPYSSELRLLGSELGIERYWQHPSLFWINSSDVALRAAAGAGCIFSLLLFFNVLPRTTLLLLFVCYLSLVKAGQVFMHFQWDYLLLESGFLALFLFSGSPVVIWLYRWLLFRLRFLSGIAKLISQDPSWAGFTALSVYFETQPLPHFGAWYAHQLPDWLLTIGVGLVFFVELVVPLMMLLPRSYRLFAAWATIAMQLAIIVTSNHNFFNLLTIAICLFLFDDQALRRVLPKPLASWLVSVSIQPRPLAMWKKSALVLLASVLLTVSVLQIWEMVSSQPLHPLASTINEAGRPFGVGRKYHVFPTMRTDRFEVVIEGSLDNHKWWPYRFRYKPGELKDRPAVVIPHQPRLDWMMWFLPTGHPLNLMWFQGFLAKLLQGSPTVLRLLADNPFPDQSPQYLRVNVYRYRFTDATTRKASSQWWTRQYLGPFFPMPMMTVTDLTAPKGPVSLP